MVACVLCGRPAICRHHPTEKTAPTEEKPKGQYLDPGFRFPHCHDHHTLVHDDLRTLGLEGTDRAQTVFERNEIRNRTTAAWLVRVVEVRGDDPIIPLILEYMVRWADEQAGGIRHLDKRYPEWRQDPGFH